MTIADMIATPRRRISKFVHREEKVDWDIVQTIRTPFIVNRIGYVALPLLNALHREMFDLK